MGDKLFCFHSISSSVIDMHIVHHMILIYQAHNTLILTFILKRNSLFNQILGIYFYYIFQPFQLKKSLYMELARII